jgi:hypothetical protein
VLSPVVQWTRVPKQFFQPIWLFDVLKLKVLDGGWLLALHVTLIVALVLAMLGLFTRIALAVAALLMLYLLGLPNNFGKTGHGDAILVLITFFLAVSRCDAALSLEHAIARRRHVSGVAPSGEYRWPIRVAWVLLALVFFCAGASKLRESGLAWITSDNFAVMLLQHHHLHGVPQTSWGLLIASQPWLCRVIAGTTVTGELLFPLILLSRRIRLVMVPLALLMQAAVGLLMGLWFWQFLLCYLFFVPWHHLSRRLPSARERLQWRQCSASPSPS